MRLSKPQDISQIPGPHPAPDWFWWLIAMCGPLLSISFAVFCLVVDDLNGGPNERSVFFWLFELFVVSVGILLFMFGMYQLKAPDDKKFDPLPQSPRFPLLWVLAMNGAAVLSTVWLYWVPKGAEINVSVPVYSFCLVILIVADLLGIPMVLLAFLTQRRVVWSWAVVVLSFSVIPLVKLIFYHAQHLRGFTLR